ncbi:MAG: LysM peptidoglycan-binding domain-containing protein [Sphingomonas sp.]
MINLEPDLSNTSQWGLMGLTRSGTGPYTFTATGTAGNLWAGNFIVAAGDTLVWDVTVRGAGSTLTDALGFYSETGWGDSSTVTASILSGPGSIALNTSAPVTLTGLQTNADTRIRITRTFATAATASAFFYVKGCNTATAGDAVTLSAPSIAYLPRYTSASEALNRISNSQFDGTTGWMTGTDPQNIVNSGSPYTGTSGGHSYIKTGFTATGSGQVASISTGASDWFKVVPGERLSASAGFEGIGPISSLTFVFNWRDANGNALPTTTIGQINGTATFNSKLSGFATVPVGAVDARLEVYMTSSAAGTGSFSMIEPMVSTASAAQTDQPPFLPTPIFDPVHDKTSRIFYDKTGRVVGTLDGEGYLSTATYDAGGFKIAETAYASQVASGDRASASLATIQSHLGTNSANRTTHYVYDNEGLLTFVVDALNHVTEYAYPGQSLGDVIGRPTKTIQYAGTISSPSGWTVAGVRAAINAVSGLASNSSNRISQAVYDAHENLSYAIDPAGGFTAFTYDNMGHVTRTVRYATLWDGSTPATFAASHASDANNRTTRSYYDARGDLTFTIDGEGYVTRYDYDAEDRQVGSVRWDNPISLASVTDATLVTDIPALVSGTYTATATSYDMDGRVASTTDGEGAITSYIYNANGTLNTSIDAYGTSDAVQTYYVYDAAGRVVSRYDAYGATEQTTTSFTYDGLGNVLTSTDPNGAVTTYDHDHLGRVITRTDALTTGVVRYQYDAFGETVKVTDARGKVSYNYYNNDGTLAYTIAPLGEVTEYRYDVFGELSDTIRYATRISLTGLTGGAASSIASTVAALANSALDSKSHLAFNANGTVSAKTDALGAVTSFGYDAFGDVTSETDPLNTGTTIQTTRTYDRRGLLKTEVVDSASGGKAITTNYNLYDAFGRVLTLTDPALQVTTKTYDRDGRVLTSTDALNQTTNYYYDKRGNLAAVQAPPPKTGDPRPVTRYAYDKLDRLVYTVDALGDVTQNTYDNDGHVILSRACAAPISLSGLPIVASLSAIATLVGAGTSGDEITHSVYDADGQLRYSIDARNFLTEYAYDAAGNAIRSVAYSTAISSTSTYTIAGIQAQIALMSGPAITLSPITRNVYNADGQRSYTIDALGFVTAYTYDTQGNVTKQVRAFKPYTTAGDPSDATMASWITANPDARDRITRAIYDQKGQLRFDVDAENYVTQYTYNEGGSVRFITRYGDRFDGTGGHIAFADATTLAQAITNVAATQVVPAAITEYRYDTAGRLVETVDPTNVHTVLTLNQLGQATQTVVAPGTTDETITKQSYDALGRVTSTTRAFGQAEVTTTSYRYDALSRVTDTLDGNGNAAISALVGTPTQAQIDAVWTAYATHYTYDANGNVLTTSVALDSGVANAVTTNTYDAFGNLVSVTDPRLNVGYFYYNTLNQLTLQVDPEGYATGTTYTFAGETESVTRYATALVSATYSATVRPTMAPPGSADETTTFGYDLLNRLTSTTDAANYTESYGLDAFGNRLSITNKLGTGAAYTTIYTYDLRGLMLTETLPMQSVAANGTILATVVTNAYKYDSRGNRVKMVEAQGLPEQRTTLYEYDALDRLTKQTGDVVATLNQGTVAPITTYQYDRQGNLLLTTDPNGARTFSYYDHLGRKTLEINAVGMASAWTYDANSNNVQQKIYGTVQTVPTTTDGTKPAITNPTVFRQTDYSFDRNNRLWKTSTPSVTTGSWNGSSYTTTTGTLITGKTYYDASGNIVQTTDGNGVSAYIYYDKAGRKVGQVDGAGYLTAYVLDQDGNVWTETRYATAVTGASASSILTSLISAAGSNANNRITQFTYDKMGRRLTEKRLNVASAAIDVNGAMTTTTADALITYTYNGLGEVASKTEAAVDVTSGVRDVTNYIYDAAGRLITTLGATMTDSAGLPVRLKTSTSYDGLNNVTRTQVGANTVSSWADRITTYTYGAGGRLMATTNAGVNAAETKLTTYSVYDLAGHLVRQDQIRNTSDAASSTVDFRTSYSYDALGRATSQQSSYLSATTPAVNDYSKNLIVNGSFEDLGTVHHTAEWGNITSSLPGWTKTNSGLLNITTGLGYGIGPTDGIYGLDSDGEGGFGSNIDIYQTINGLTAGQVLQLGLDHMDVRYTNSIEVSWNGVVIGTLTGTGTVMKTDWLNVTAIAGGNTLRLRETGSQDAYGMVLDNVRLFAALPSSASSGWVNGDSQGVAYDAYGEIVAQTINGTLTTQAVYDSTGHVVQSNSGDGTWKTYINDGNGNATLTIQTIGTTDLAPLTVAQALALATNNGANTAGAAAGNGVVVTIGVFDARNQQTQVLMPLRDSVMDANNVVTSYTVGQNLIKTTQAYNAFGEVASQTDARGNTTSFVYNSMGRVTAQISPQVQITGENGQASSSVQTRYDASSAWNTTPTQYSYFDASGRLVATRDANGNLNTRILLAGSGYGGADPLTLVEIHPDGGKIKTGYDVFGDAVKITDALNKVTTNIFDQVGNLIEVRHPIRALNSDGSAGDGLQLIDYYSYDGLSERVGHSNNVLTNPIYGAPVAEYHNGGYPNYTGYTTYSSPITGYTPVTETTAYDSQGRVISTTDFGGHTIQYLYQWNGAQATAGLATYGGWTKIATYMDSAKTSKDTTDAFGRQVAKTDLGGNVYSYTFNKAGELITETSVTSAGVAAENIAYTYYNTGKISTISDNSTRSVAYYSASVASAFSYDRAGNRLTTSYISVSNFQNLYWGFRFNTTATTVLENSTATYDAMNRVVTISDPGDSANKRPSFSQTRTYDANGNVRSNITTHQGIDSNQNLTAATTDSYWFAYDTLNEFVVTEGTLSGAVGAAGTHVVGGTTGTVITYYATGQRRTAASYSGYQYSQDTYVYTADGYLSTVGMGTSWDGITFTSPVIRSVDTRDALGRVTAHNEYNASGATYNAGSHSWTGSVVYGRTATYNNLGQVTWDQVSVVQGSDTNVTSTTYSYVQRVFNGSTGLWVDTARTYLSGNVLSQVTSNLKNNDYAHQYTVTTSNSYSWYDNAQQREITAASSGNQTGNTTSIFSYDGNGHVAQVTRSGQYANTISYTTTVSGQIMARKQQQSAGGASPAEYYFYLNNVMVGQISNNGSENLNYAASINQQTTAAGTGPFANGATSGAAYANFDLSYQAMNPTAAAENGSAQAYTVIQGDTLSTVAQNIYGDSALWYLIAEVNGLNANSPLTAGQILLVPNKVANSHNNASTFRPYNPNAALGDVQPGTPVPPKKNCGILGMILLAVIAVAVAYFVGPAAIHFFQGALGGLVAGTGAVAAGSAGAIGGAIIGGAVTGALASAVSQGIGVATGLQDQFSWKAVGLAALGGAVTAGIGPGGIFGGNGLGAALGIGSKVLQVGFNGAVGSAITQGIGVATHLQDKFSWAGVAVAGIGAMAGYEATKLFGATSLVDVKDANGNVTTIGDHSIGNNLANLGVSAAKMLAKAATRSVIEGTDFGDNIISELPDAIGETIVGVIGEAISKKAPGPGKGTEKSGPSPKSVVAPGSAGASTNDGPLSLKQRAEMTHYARATSRLSGSVQFSGGEDFSPTASQDAAPGAEKAAGDDNDIVVTATNPKYTPIPWSGINHSSFRFTAPRVDADGNSIPGTQLSVTIYSNASRMNKYGYRVISKGSNSWLQVEDMERDQLLLEAPYSYEDAQYGVWTEVLPEKFQKQSTVVGVKYEKILPGRDMDWRSWQFDPRPEIANVGAKWIALDEKSAGYIDSTIFNGEVADAALQERVRVALEDFDFYAGIISLPMFALAGGPEAEAGVGIFETVGARLFPKAAGRVAAGRVAAETGAASKVVWVDENVGLKGLAKDYNDSAMGARSNPFTKTGQAPALERTMPDGTTRLVKFDGVDGNVMVDRKVAIVTTQKAKDQALRQSEVLAQNGLTGRWEVPTVAQQTRAVKMLNTLNVNNIKVVVEKPW